MTAQPTQKMIFVNLPVKDLKKSIAFYEAIGAKRDERFCDDNGACMVISDTIHAMLLTHARYSDFTKKAIPDAKQTAQVLLCLSENSREDVDATTAKAGASGGTIDPCPAQDYGFMYGRSFEDPDGHIWEVMWMDLAAFDAARGSCHAA